MILCQCLCAVSLAPEYAVISFSHGSACMRVHWALILVDVRRLSLSMAIAFLHKDVMLTGCDGIESNVVISACRSCVLA